ncbi:MAG: hypothetical protein ACYC19_03035 [Acidimicrobiales bacterium]
MKSLAVLVAETLPLVGRFVPGEGPPLKSNWPLIAPVTTAVAPQELIATPLARIVDERRTRRANRARSVQNLNLIDPFDALLHTVDNHSAA